MNHLSTRQLPDLVLMAGEGPVAISIYNTLAMMRNRLKVARLHRLDDLKQWRCILDAYPNKTIVYFCDANSQKLVASIHSLLFQMREDFEWTGGILFIFGYRSSTYKLKKMLLVNNTSGHAYLKQPFSLSNLLDTLSSLGEMSHGQWLRLKRRMRCPSLFTILTEVVAAVDKGNDLRKGYTKFREAVEVLAMEGTIDEIDDWTCHQGRGPANRLLQGARQKEPTRGLKDDLLDDINILIQCLKPYREWW